MTSIPLRNVAIEHPALSGHARRALRHQMRGMLRAAAIATLLITLGAAGTASAQSQSCDTLCVNQNADQRALLSPSQQLLSTTAGQALLQANLQTEENMYQTATAAQKNTAARTPSSTTYPRIS